MTHKEAAEYFLNKYYEIARKYHMYTKCRNNNAFKEMCIKTVIECGLNGLEYKSVDQISEEDMPYFLLMGDHFMESLIIVAKRNYKKK